MILVFQIAPTLQFLNPVIFLRTFLKCFRIGIFGSIFFNTNFVHPMKTLFTLVLLVLSLSVYAQTTAHKRVIDVSKIDNIEIMKLNKENPHKFQSKMMNSDQYAGFADTWLKAKYLGPEKFKLTEYYIFVTFKDGEKRQFTVSGSNAVGCKLQESESASFEIKDKLYFDNLWYSIR